jgi:hypothetical protein
MPSRHENIFSCDISSGNALKERAYVSKVKCMYLLFCRLICSGCLTVLSILDAFHSDVGFCLVMDIYAHTLLDLIYREPVAPFSTNYAPPDSSGEIVVPRSFFVL